ncbi:MAG: GNAT family N-acetyltransferase [Burkholderiaceae bacterium]
MDPSPSCGSAALSFAPLDAAPPSNILVREAGVDDAELIAQLTRISWAEKVAASSSGHREDVARVLHDLQLGGGFILQVDGQVAGSVRWLRHDYEPSVWDIVRMGVLPEFRGVGLSQHLLEAVIHHALAADVDELRLAVRTDQSRLVDLYAAFGFELAPELEYAHANPQEPAPLLMRKLL